MIATLIACLPSTLGLLLKVMPPTKFNFVSLFDMSCCPILVLSGKKMTNCLFVARKCKDNHFLSLLCQPINLIEMKRPQTGQIFHSLEDFVNIFGRKCWTGLERQPTDGIRLFFEEIEATIAKGVHLPAIMCNLKGLVWFEIFSI